MIICSTRVSKAAKLLRDTNKFLHLSVILGADLLESGTELCTIIRHDLRLHASVYLKLLLAEDQVNLDFRQVFVEGLQAKLILMFKGCIIIIAVLLTY